MTSGLPRLIPCAAVCVYSYVASVVYSTVDSRPPPPRLQITDLANMAFRRVNSLATPPPAPAAVTRALDPRSKRWRRLGVVRVLARCARNLRLADACVDSVHPAASGRKEASSTPRPIGSDRRQTAATAAEWDAEHTPRRIVADPAGQGGGRGGGRWECETRPTDGSAMAWQGRDDDGAAAVDFGTAPARRRRVLILIHGLRRRDSGFGSPLPAQAPSFAAWGAWGAGELGSWERDPEICSVKMG
ncbi:hypothetical protein BT67DRAFT_150508 [Trichocladium antarcticum]|uniref:Uncharacterized protein n=1 Tax=Trichocladium antarcticum TaxID=1450529 RepID=A0AAN6UF39_9PEZI|nr:hypothetical protein BT67DRAFT_150508 [Trichocladium antarcticum]